MEIDERGYRDIDESICREHLLDPWLAAAGGEPAWNECNFCGRADPGSDPFAVSLGDVMQHFMQAFWSSYGRLHTAPVIDDEYAYTLDTSAAVWFVGETAFAKEVEDDVLDCINRAIIDSEVDTRFSEFDTDYLGLGWQQFSATAKHISRFVMPSEGESRSPMSRVVGFLDELTTYVDGRLGLVKRLPVGTTIYRGRLTSPEKPPHQESDFGLAPKDRAASNRMSPAGVPMFYGSEDAETAVAEIAFHGIEPMAAVASFETTQELVILDLTYLPPLISPFDLERKQEARLRDFLREFVREITRSIEPDGRQHIEYAPTQVLTEYLRWKPAQPLDGIALPSVQTGRKSYVLFLDNIAAAETPTGSFEQAGPATFKKSLQFNPVVELFRIQRTVTAVKEGFHAAESWVMKPESID